jgi:hypothetical protein
MKQSKRGSVGNTPTCRKCGLPLTAGPYQCMGHPEYSRYGLSTTDKWEVLPVRIRSAGRCSECRRDLPPGTPIFRWIQEVYTTGRAFCPECAVAHPIVGIFARIEEE